MTMSRTGIIGTRFNSVFSRLNIAVLSLILFPRFHC